MKTWAKQLEDILPKADPFTINDIIRCSCPNDFFVGDAPDSTGCPNADAYDAEVCLDCWESCDHFCKYLKGKVVLQCQD